MFDEVIDRYSEIVTRFRNDVDGRAVLCGGALRDTFYGVEVKDLDFVLLSRDPQGGHRGWSPLSPELVAAFPDKTLRWVEVGELGEQYHQQGGNGPLIDVIESTDKTINIIVVQNIEQYTNNFPDSISEMVFDGTTVHYSQRWAEGNLLHVVYYDADKMNQPRLDKLMLKYPNWEFIPE